MPKERLHLLLTDKVLEAVYPEDASRPPDPALRDAARLGSIVPDILFHDVPWFRYAGLSCGIHARYEGETGARRIIAHLGRSSSGESEDAERTAFFLGIAGHFLTDGLVHPLIRELSRPDSWCSRRLHLSETCCHLWVESQLESYWIPRRGPSGGYRDFFSYLLRKGSQVRRLIRHWRAFLAEDGWHEPPREADMLRCLGWQSRLLCWFTSPWLSRRADLMVRIPGLRGVGVLVVPEHPMLARWVNPSNSQVSGLDAPFRPGFPDRVVRQLSNRLRALGAPWP